MNTIKKTFAHSIKVVTSVICLGLGQIAMADIHREIQTAADLGEVSQIQPYTNSNDRVLAAYAYYQQSQGYLASSKKSAADDAAEKASATLKAYLSTHPENVEAHSLYSIVLGYQISLDFSKAVTNSKLSADHADKALQIQSNHPMALMAKGINKHFTPAFFGGSNTEAEQLLTQAIKEFKNKGDLSWGLADAYMWRGTVRNDMGNPAAALMDAEQALALTPQDFLSNQLHRNVKGES